MLLLNLPRIKTLTSGDEYMAVMSIIKLSGLETGKRVDAEYYQPEFLKNKKFILNINLPKFSIKELSAYITNGHTPYHADLSKGEIPFLTAEDIFDFYISFGTAKRITREASQTELKRTILHRNDLLVTIKGKIGNCAIIYKINKEINCNQDVARIVVKKGFNPYYIAAFLNSKFGKLQINQLSTGQINPFLGLKNLIKVTVPFIPKKEQQKIADLILEGLKNFESSLKFYSEAESYLLAELELKSFRPKPEKTYTANLSDVSNAHRIDAEYFQPAYWTLVDKLNKYGSTPLLNSVESIPARFDPKSQSLKTFQYVELSNIASSVGTIDSYSEVSGYEAPGRAKRVLKANDVILSRVEGSLEKVALVYKEQEGYLASNGFFQFRSKDILPEVLLVLAKSFVVQMQFEKQTAGTILTSVSKDAPKKILIPKFNRHAQEEIALLVQQSHEARKKAKELLEIAKKTVEIAIEKYGKDVVN